LSSDAMNRAADVMPKVHAVRRFALISTTSQIVIDH
jgi:hypothetical protein